MKNENGFEKKISKQNTHRFEKMKRWWIVATLVCFSKKDCWAFTRPVWTPDSWKNFKPYQMPIYPNPVELQEVESGLKNKSPLVFAGECERLHHFLGMASCRKAFVIMGGDCAETFSEFSPNKVRDDFRLLLKLSLIMTYASGLPVIQIARTAGQFGKPRSSDTEERNGIELPSYRGDIINSQGFSLKERTPDPKRMIEAYHQSAQTLNLIRAFIQGGLSDVYRMRDWCLEHVSSSHPIYQEMVDQVERCLLFIQSMEGKKATTLKIDRFFTGHECLLLPYEQALTRTDSLTQRHFDCSAHFLWLGERTRHLDSAQVEFMRGIGNPIGIKISEKTKPNELIELLHLLNPHNFPGRITLITRMGKDNLKLHLPTLIETVEKEKRSVLWVCDPMHGNTFSIQGFKTRSLSHIFQELEVFFDVHKKMGTFPGGIHLEITSKNVTECIDPYRIQPKNLHEQYDSTCDPRLNIYQALDIGFWVGQRLMKEQRPNSFSSSCL